jgi:hypothetical protein
MVSGDMGVLRAFHILLIVGGILSFAALPLLVSSTATSAADTATIPAGQRWYMSYYFNVLGGGTLRGNFQEITGGSLNLFVLTEAQYDAYRSGNDGGSLYSLLSSRGGSFGVVLPGSGKYYLVADHGVNSFAIAQEMRFDVQVRGINPTIFVVGVGFFAAGVVFAFWGARRRREGPSRPFFRRHRDIPASHEHEPSPPREPPLGPL